LPADVIVNGVRLLEGLDNLSAYRVAQAELCQPYRLASNQADAPTLTADANNQLHIRASDVRFNGLTSWFEQLQAYSEQLCDVSMSELT
jgi:hypothetical protein